MNLVSIAREDNKEKRDHNTRCIFLWHEHKLNKYQNNGMRVS